jgi:hypothetical protein
MNGFENYGLEAGVLVSPDVIPDFLELSEEYPEAQSLLLDQPRANLKGLTADQQHWRDQGYVVKRGFLPHDLIDAYDDIRRTLRLGSGPFADITPYLNHSVIRDLCCSRELHYLLVDLLGEEMGLHFILADYKSTTRGWHQDDYLNPDDTYGRYAAIWMAMDDIDPDSGPFQFVPGSHKWPCLRNGKVKQLVVPRIREDDNHHWAVAAEYLVNKSVEHHIERTGSRVETFSARKGDILIWHAKLMHRGSIPNDPALLRPALIAHYSNIRSRRDLGVEITRHREGGYFWEFSGMGRSLSEDIVPRPPGERSASADAGAPGPRPFSPYRFGVRTRLRRMLQRAKG